MSTDETIRLLRPSCSDKHPSKSNTSTSDSTEMKPRSDVTNSQTGDANQNIDFKEFGLPGDAMYGTIVHSKYKVQKFIRFSFNRDDYNDSKENGENEDNTNDGNSDDESNEGSKNNDDDNNDKNSDSNGNKDDEKKNNENNEESTSSNNSKGDDNNDNENNHENNMDTSCYKKLGERLYKFITECWGVDPPEYVLSLVGYSLNLPNSTLRNIIMSLKAMTRIKGSWSIGQAVEYSDNTNACGEANRDNQNICIGFIDGDFIDGSRIVKSNDDRKYTFEIKSGKLNINPNYTHIIIVDDVDVYRLQAALSCAVDCFSFIIPVHSKNGELFEISRVSSYSEIVKKADKDYIYLTLLDHDAKNERVLTYARRSIWKLLWDKDTDKELELMIKELYKKKYEGIFTEEEYKEDVEKTYKQTVKIMKNFDCFRIVSTKSDHIFQNEVLQEMRYSKMFQSVCLAMAWETEDVSYWIDTYYEKYVNKYKKGQDDQNNENKIEELRRDMLLASLLSGKLKNVQHVIKVFGVPKLTKHFLEDLYNASLLMHEPCVNWQEYNVNDHSVEIQDYSYVEGEGGGDDDGKSSGGNGRANNDISGGECPYSDSDVFKTCLQCNADYTKFKAFIPSDKKHFPDSLVNGEDPSKALFKWAVLHSLDDIALQLSQTGNDFKHQLEMLLVAVAIIFRLRRNAQELKTGEEVCAKRLQRYSNICRVFMATSYEEGMTIDVDDNNVRFALENGDVFGQEFVENFASSDAVQESIQEKWKGSKEHNSDKGFLHTACRNSDTPQLKFYVHSLFYFVFLTFLSYIAVTLPTKQYNFPTSPFLVYSQSTMCTFSAVYSLLYVSSYIGMEIKQFCEIMKKFKGDPWFGAKSYLLDKWNLLDLLCILFFLAVIPLVLSSYTYEVGRVVLAVDVSFWIFRILQILKYLEKTGMWIEMLWQIFLDLLKFLSIPVIVLFSFGVGITAIKYPGTDFFESAMKKPYFAIYGEYFLSDLEEEKDPLVWFISIIYMGVYLLVAHILVLNVLIAVFNDSYNDVRAKGIKIWKLSRYDLLQEYKARPILPPPFTIFELVMNLCNPTINSEKDDAIDEILTHKSWMDNKIEKGFEIMEILPGDEGNALNDKTSYEGVAQRCLSLAIEQVPDDPSEVSNYEVKAQLIKKLDEQQKRSDEQKKESNDEFQDQLEKRLEERLKEANEKLEKRLDEQRKESNKEFKDQLGKRLEEQLKEANEKLEKRFEDQLKEQENKLINKFDVLLKHLKANPVTDEQ